MPGEGKVDRTIAEYYDRLAPTYDQDRFGGTYGTFIDRSERGILRAMLPTGAGDVLDVGCGTGRLTDFATQGCDASGESVRLAAKRHPDKAFQVANATALPYPDASCDAAICFHVLMHLERDVIARLFGEVARVLRPGGTFVVDVASARRRRSVRRPNSGWHGDTSLTRGEIAALAGGAGLALAGVAGVAMVPIHRVPSRLRGLALPADRLLCRIAPDLSSYLVARLIKAPAG